MSRRNPLMLGTWGSEKEGGVRVVAARPMWKQPAKWSKEAVAAGERHRVFNASLADWAEHWEGPIFDHLGNETNWTLDQVIDCLFDCVDQTVDGLDWLMLTKRPQNIPAKWRSPRVQRYGENGRSNVWLGTTTENQKYADIRIPQLLACRDLAPVLFLSVEPMLGPVDLGEAVGYSPEHGGHFDPMKSRVDWVICGAEDGPGRRPMDVGWARSLRDQCKVAGVPFFMKQLEVDGKVTDDVTKFPVDLQIQEFPSVVRC
jgi:protein gp37